jgi:hypothetical protein
LNLGLGMAVSSHSLGYPAGNEGSYPTSWAASSARMRTKSGFGMMVLEGRPSTPRAHVPVSWHRLALQGHEQPLQHKNAQRYKARQKERAAASINLQERSKASSFDLYIQTNRPHQRGWLPGRCNLSRRFKCLFSQIVPKGGAAFVLGKSVGLRLIAGFLRGVLNPGSEDPNVSFPILVRL